MKPQRAGAAIRGALFIALAVASVLAWQWALRPDNRLTITFLDVGQGDAIAIRTPNGHTILVDSGPRANGDDAGRRCVIPFLRSQGVNGVDALLLTHEDSDHIGGASTIVQRLAVEHVLGPVGQEHRNRILDGLTDAGRAVHYGELAAGDVVRTDDGLELDVLRPPRASPAVEYESENDTCLVVMVRYREFTALLTGDMGAQGEQDLLATGANIHAVVLKLGHHGSSHSSTEAFLRAVRPRLAIVSAGRHNVYGHPHPSVLARLAMLGIAVRRTDQQGSVSVETDGRMMTCSTMR